jgi:hypothetical protein
MAASFSARLPSEKAPIQFLSQGFLYSLKPGAMVWLQTSQKEAKRIRINAALFVRGGLNCTGTGVKNSSVPQSRFISKRFPFVIKDSQ